MLGMRIRNLTRGGLLMPTDINLCLPPSELRQAVAQRYGQVASDPEATSLFPVGRAFAEAVGYPAAQLDALPSAAVKSFTGVTYLLPWCELSPGETVVDLGCGAGVDAILAAGQVGPSGHVHGIDLAPEMVALARDNVGEAGLATVEIHQAAVEALPLNGEMADVVTANGVFNLTPSKDVALAEAFRALKPGGRLIAAEIVLTEILPEAERNTLDDWFR